MIGAASLALVMLTYSGAFAQGTLTPQSVNSGGDTRQGAFGEFYSTIGEPFATDSVSASDDQSTWTGFWQVVPIFPNTGGVEIHTTTPFGSGAGIVATAPNPFATSLDIDVDIPRTGAIDLAACDLTGRRVETLLSGRRDRGGLRVRWHPDELSPGTYFLVLAIDGQQLSVRVVNYYR